MAQPSPTSSAALRQRDVALVDLLDRVLAGGVVIAGEITLSIADVDLVRISLRALIASVRSIAGDQDGDPP
ncbi:gas vesicle protein [Kitasatospora terrestris]|uniref:Gas vesicle protein n=1 Tax=Kitasatospora terrestris TaxID=258051 RepID=A0ABP9EMV2_9ACTN